MNWIKVSDALPEINADGYSRYVLVVREDSWIKTEEE